MSSDPTMYRWSQWLFLTLLEAGLVYRGTANVDWCDTCQTTLATIQVEDGLCWRCHNPVRLIERPTWFLRISAYMQENDRRLDELRGKRQMGRGRAGLAALRARPRRRRRGRPARPDGSQLTVFTPHAEALEQARFVLISPQHPETDAWASDPAVASTSSSSARAGWERSSRDARAFPLIDTGHRAAARRGARCRCCLARRRCRFGADRRPSAFRRRTAPTR